MTVEQVRTLKAFVNDALLGGSLTFSMKSQTSTDRVLARFRTLPSFERLTGNRFSVRIDVEVLDSLPALPLVFVSEPLPPAREGVGYSWSPRVTEGSRPLQPFRIVSGSLPSGLVFSGEKGEIGGTPTDFGSGTFTIRATDRLGRTTDAARSINIRPPGWIFWQDGSIIDPVVSRPAAGASYLSREGNMTGAAVNQPRFDHDANGQLKGVLVEQASTNMWAHSGLGSGWIGDGAVAPTITNGVSGLGHQMVAIEFAANEQVGYHGTHARGGSTALVHAGVTHTHSIYMTLSRPLMNGESLLYYATGNNAAPGVYLDPSNSAHLVGQWGRIIPAPFTPTFDSFVYPVVTPNTSIQSPLVVYVSYWQMEPGNVASSPILTNTGAVHRPSDVISFEMPAPNNRVVYTFDDGSTQTLNGVGPTHTIPLTLSRRHIRRIDARPQP